MAYASLFPEDYERIVKMNSCDGPCWQISHLANCALKGVLSKVVSRLNEQCGRILDDGWDYSDCGYEFRNGFECACWLKHDCAQGHLFGPELDIGEEIESAVRHVLVAESDHLALRLILAWYWTDEALDKRIQTMPVTDWTDNEVEEILAPFIISSIDEQMASTSSYVDKQIAFWHIETERLRKAQFEYNNEDYYCEHALSELYDESHGNKLIEKALTYVKKFMAKELTDEDFSNGFTLVYRDGGECRYVEFDLDEEALRIREGGYAQSEAGGDSYGDEVWRLDAYSHTNDSFDVVPRAIELLNMGGTIEEL